MINQQNSELLLQLREALKKGAITQAEVKHAISIGDEANWRLSAMLPALGILGAVVCFAGLSILLAQHWNEFGSLMRIALTLGSGLVSYAVSLILFVDDDTKPFSPILALFAVLLLPGGVAVALHEGGYDLANNSTQLFMAFSLFVTFAAPAVILKSNAMLIAAVWSLTALFFVSTNMLVDGMRVTHSFHEYRALLTGLFYCALAFAVRDDKSFGVSSGALYFMGSAVALCAGFNLMGSKPNQEIIWELLYPGLAVAGIYLGAEVRSRALMINGALGLNAYIVKISGQYFAASLGWPLTMMCAGVGIIAVAMYSTGLYRSQQNLLAADSARE